jgi:hypothetical protein
MIGSFNIKSINPAGINGNLLQGNSMIESCEPAIMLPMILTLIKKRDLLNSLPKIVLFAKFYPET